MAMIIHVEDMINICSPCIKINSIAELLPPFVDEVWSQLLHPP